MDNKNLRTTKYNDLTDITHATSNAGWSDLNVKAYCYYKNTADTDSIERFGAMYNWNAVITGRLAPQGWHVATEAEWDTLRNYLIANGYNYDGATTGNKIAKSLAAMTDWNTSTTTGGIGRDLTKNNRSGFSALPGGRRNNAGSFSTMGNIGQWWEATWSGASGAYSRQLYYDTDDLSRPYPFKACGLSVRLVRD